MYQKERLDEIFEIIKQNGYVTVKHLKNELHYSNSTINRDLNILEKQGHIKRSYGGVEIVKRKGIPLPFRYDFMKSEKSKIGQKAAEFVKDGDTVFIDATTTTQSMGRYLAEKKDLTVITNNIALVIMLSEYGINTICLGGKVVEKPYMLYSTETVENAAHYHIDKMFFASGSITSDGKIGCGEFYSALYRTIKKNTDKIYYLADHDKIDKPYTHIPATFEELDYIITDYKFDASLKEKFKNVTFVEI